MFAAVLPWPRQLGGDGGRSEEYCRRLIVDAITYSADVSWARKKLRLTIETHDLTLAPAEPFRQAPCPPSRKVVARRGSTCGGGWSWGRYARGHG